MNMNRIASLITSAIIASLTLSIIAVFFSGFFGVLLFTALVAALFTLRS
jgi:hypothetical protein